MATRVVVIGVGRIGAVTAIGLAHLQLAVVGVDRSAERVAMLAAGQIPEAEPGLRSALTAALRYRSLSFTHCPPEGRSGSPVACVDTPPLATGEPDLRQILAAATDAAGLLSANGILVTRSTVPVGTGDRLDVMLARLGRPDIEVVHVPEFLREGHAWDDFREPDRIVVGAESSEAGARVRAVFEPLRRPIIVTRRRTAELAKYAANAFLATSVSFANELSDLCEVLAIDATALFGILHADRRIGSQAYLTPGLGFGGHCLPKDTAALEQLAAAHGQSLAQLQATRQVNRGRTLRVVAWLRRALGGLDGRRVCLAGLAFKPGTDDLRESPSLHLARALALEGTLVLGWDPLVRAHAPYVDVTDSLDEALEDADALVVGHSWSGWRDLDPVGLARRMRCTVVYDAPGILDTDRWIAAGFVTSRQSPSAAAAEAG